jgi:RNA polymerase sigma factor (TIGR02999 family)
VKEITSILAAVDDGDPKAAEELLPLVYDELRRLAARRLANERPGQTLQPTALVHEAFLRLVRNEDPQWHGRRHFFSAAAEAMRRLLIERARRKKSLRGGGELQRVEWNETEIAAPLADDDLLALHEALDQLAVLDSLAASLIKLRFFVGLTHQDAAEILGMSRSAADRAWLFARAWLFQQIRPGQSPPPSAAGRSADPGDPTAD